MAPAASRGRGASRPEAAAPGRRHAGGASAPTASVPGRADRAPATGAGRERPSRHPPPRTACRGPHPHGLLGLRRTAVVRRLRGHRGAPIARRQNPQTRSRATAAVAGGDLQDPPENDRRSCCSIPIQTGPPHSHPTMPDAPTGKASPHEPAGRLAVFRPRLPNEDRVVPATHQKLDPRGAFALPYKEIEEVGLATHDAHRAGPGQLGGHFGRVVERLNPPGRLLGLARPGPRGSGGRGEGGAHHPEQYPVGIERQRRVQMGTERSGAVLVRPDRCEPPGPGA